MGRGEKEEVKEGRTDVPEENFVQYKRACKHAILAKLG